MILRIGPPAGAPAVRLEEPGELDRFHVESGFASPDPLAEAVRRAGLGVLTADGHLLVPAGLLRELAGAERRPDDAGWDVRFDAMLARARTAGWTDGAGRVRAHVVLAGDAGPGA